MSQPTTREVISGLHAVAGRLYAADPFFGQDTIVAAISKLEAVADAEDARPEQPEAMELDLTQFDREALRELRPGQLQSMLHEFMPVTRSEFEALVSRVEACEGRK